jgi:hypothetical protein
MGACENPNLPVEMAEGRVKYRANEPAALDTTKLPEPYPQHPLVEHTFKRRKTPQREIPERVSRLGTVVTGWCLSGSIAGWGSRQ